MIESRELNREELEEIISDAPLSETRNLIKFLCERKEEAFDYFKNNSVFSFGLVSENRPIYFAYIIQNRKGEYQLWTVVNSDVREQFSLYKYSKKSLMYALTLFGQIYATMEKGNDRNIKWVEHIGFKRIFENEKLIKFMIK